MPELCILFTIVNCARISNQTIPNGPAFTQRPTLKPLSQPTYVYKYTHSLTHIRCTLEVSVYRKFTCCLANVSVKRQTTSSDLSQHKIISQVFFGPCAQTREFWRFLTSTPSMLLFFCYFSFFTLQMFFISLSLFLFCTVFAIHLFMPRLP